MISRDQLSLFLQELSEDEIECNSTEEIVTKLSKATFLTKGQALALIEPESTEQIRAVLTRANKFQVPIYPISQGKNWGYGSVVPPGEGAVVLSLKKLNRILNFDSESGVISLEPGVSFRQVQNFLIEQNSRWQLNAPGSTSEASVVANTLSRGLIQGPRPEKWREVIALKILLANGQTIDTETGVSKGSFRPTMTGPDLLPLFFQSNLGIVVEMKLRLDWRPACWQHAHLTWKELNCPLDSMLSTFKMLVRENLVAGNVSLHSAEKILSMTHDYPDTPTKATPLPKELRDQMLEEIGGGDWFLETAIAAHSETMLSEKRILIEEAMKSLAVDVSWSIPNESGPIFHHKTETAPEQMYWRKAKVTSKEIKPEEDGCGVLWISPVLPWHNHELLEVFECIQSITHRKGFETLVTYQFVNVQYVYVIISLLYDRNLPGQDQLALEAFEGIKGYLGSKGYFSYRLSLLEQPLTLVDDDIRLKLKESLDPNNIIAPNFYISSRSQ